MQNWWGRLSIIVLVIAFLLGLVGGCGLLHEEAAPDPDEIGNNSGEPDGDGSDTAPNDETTPPGETTPGGTDGKEEKDKEEERKVEITLYFGDRKAVEEDSPCETGYVSPVVREFPHTTGVLRLALQELIRGPLPGEGDLARTLPATVKILNLKIENGVALIDFSPELLTAPDSPGGTLGGSILIQSLVYTATEFFNVKSVLVTVNGETYSDGHFIWEYPIGREDFNFSG